MEGLCKTAETCKLINDKICEELEANKKYA